MKYLVQIFFIVLSSFLGKTQNLITNPSFEDIDSCYGAPAPIGFDVFQWAGCTGWSNPIGSSSDLYCENPIIGNTTPPIIGGYYKFPKTGENMAAILINSGIIFNYREYIQNELNVILTPNTVYDIEFYISASGYDDCLSNQFGVKFFPIKYDNSSQLWLTDLIPDAVNDVTKFSADTSIWQKIEMKYLANGTEKFVVIGNFQDSLSMTYSLPCDTSFWGNMTFAGGYYFVDDVTIQKASPLAIIPNVFTPNGDNINDYFMPKVYNTDEWQMIIINRWGNEVARLSQNLPTWDGNDNSDGVYFYNFSTPTGNIEQGFISIIRD